MTNNNLTIKAIKMLAMDEIREAKSGHPGIVLGATSIVYTLYHDVMKYNPEDPMWFNRDRFVLSAGHGSAMLYAALHLAGFNIKLNDLKKFRKLNSITPGHPEYKVTPGVDATTGPLGQGLAMAVGMALAERILANKFNKENFNIIDHYTFVLSSDGDLMEGVASEASSLAGRLKLGKLIVLYDSNNISLDGPTSFTFTEDVLKRYEAYGWQTIEIKDGNNLNALKRAINKAKRTLDKPTLIKVNTTIGEGAKEEGTNVIHGTPLSDDSYNILRENLEWNYSEFSAPIACYEDFAEITKVNTAKYNAWQNLFNRYKKKYPQLAKELISGINLEINFDYEKEFKKLKKEETIATRNALGNVLNIICKKLPYLIGGSADISASTKTYIKDAHDILPETNYQGRNIWFGVREFAMGAILNGISLHGGLRPFGSTFLVFSDYMRPSIRMSALMGFPVIYIFTHDSILVGEDGPTHQPIEQLASLRLIPNTVVLRPADQKETIGAFKIALENKKGPTIIVLTRQNVKTLDKTNTSKVKDGAYVVSSEKEKLDLILLASGSEVELALKTQEELLKHNIDSRVVSLFSYELFKKKPKTYQEKIIPENTKVFMIELGATSINFGKNFYQIGIDEFARSGSKEDLLKYCRFTPHDLAEYILKVLN
ncbi:MAG TPA: transketolase [Tenericutes bacterium]|jgi:transketolase|nr:transketolase [Mycoplasmatota bacterium]